jgi:mRNA-degrading endonuclease RelE of RelBE toxin-antitoxin system
VPAPREVILAPEIRELVRVFHPTTKRKVRAAIEAIRATPEIGDELTRELSGLRRLRVGRLRIVYQIQGRQIQIVAIGPRATIYLDLSAQRGKR